VCCCLLHSHHCSSRAKTYTNLGKPSEPDRATFEFVQILRDGEDSSLFCSTCSDSLQSKRLPGLTLTTRPLIIRTHSKPVGTFPTLNYLQAASVRTKLVVWPNPEHRRCHSRSACRTELRNQFRPQCSTTELATSPRLLRTVSTLLARPPPMSLDGPPAELRSNLVLKNQRRR
jgi:hypothetical protein